MAEIQLKMEQEFDRSKINYSQLLGKFNKGLLLMGQEGVIVEANEFSHIIFGAQSLVGKSFLSFIKNDEVLLFAKRMQQLLVNDESEIDVLLNLNKENRESIAVRLSATLTNQLKDNQIIIFIENIEENKNLAYELNASNHALDMFAYRASHDLKGPVASIRGLCNIMSLNPKNEPNTFIDLINTECDKMEISINKLSEISTLKKESNSSVVLDFPQIIRDVCDDLSFDLNFDIQIENSIQSDFHSSPTYIRAIFYHLLENANKFRKRNKAEHNILIDLYEEKNVGIYIKVKDSGIGIEASELPKVFDIFYKGDSKYAGSGIGLYLVKDMVERLKGKVKIDSKAGQFTMVSIFFPIND